jgi:hypothetical protein
MEGLPKGKLGAIIAEKRCSKLSHPNLAPGWGCCSCNTYNGIQRHECKNCKHIACYREIEVEDRT